MKDSILYSSLSNVRPIQLSTNWQNYGVSIMQFEEMQKILDDISYLDWNYNLNSTSGFTWFLQLHFPSKDLGSGEPCIVLSRKWMMSKHMTKSEVVQTALMATLAAIEHEARENFRYCGRTIFGPHFDVVALTKLAAFKENLDMRTGEWVNDPM